MSFILDALRKSEHERQDRIGPDLAHVRVAHEGEGVPRWVIVLGALLLLAPSQLTGTVAWGGRDEVVAYQATGATIAPQNRGGALSFLLSFRFVGHAIGPLLWVPVFERSAAWAFLGAGLLGLAAAGALWFVVDQTPSPTNSTRFARAARVAATTP